MLGAEGARKVVVIGLDGMDWGLVNQWSGNGKLPNLAKIMTKGVSGKLRTPIQPGTVPGWNCFSTGKNPGKLGVYDFLSHADKSYHLQPYFFNLPREKDNIWDILSANGRKVCILGVPIVFSVYEINGFMTSGWLSQSEEIETYPDWLKPSLDKLTGGFETDVYQFSYKDVDKFLVDLYDVTEKQFKAIDYLVSNFDFDFLFTVFTGLDRIQHCMWKFMDNNHPLHRPEERAKYGEAVLRYYQRMDEIVKKLLEKVDTNTVTLLVSDHGFGPHCRWFNINEWLRRKGLLKLKKRKEIYRAILERATPVWDRSKLSKLDDSKLLRRVRGAAKLIIGLDLDPEHSIDWSNTKAYALRSVSYGRIYINLEGREPNGIVRREEEYEEVRKYIMQELQRDCLKEGLGIEIFKPEEIYHGEKVGGAPDILFMVDKLACIGRSSFGYYSDFSPLKSSRNPLARDGNHRLDGIFVATGRGIKSGHKIENTNIVDIAPTILHILQAPLPMDMDGRVLKGIFDEESELARRPVEYQQTNEQERIRSKIRRLRSRDKV